MILDNAYDQQRAANWADELVQRNDWLILDTANKGLGALLQLVKFPSLILGQAIIFTLNDGPASLCQQCDPHDLVRT